MFETLVLLFLTALAAGAVLCVGALIYSYIRDHINKDQVSQGEPYVQQPSTSTISPEILDILVKSQQKQYKSGEHLTSISPTPRAAVLDLSQYVDEHGVEDTFERLRVLARESASILSDFEEFGLQGSFEAELVCMSYYMYYLVAIRKSEHAKAMSHYIVKCYNDKLDLYLESEEQAIFNHVVKNRGIFIYDKLSWYWQDVLATTTDETFLPRYTFASLYLYPLSSSGSILADCDSIDGENVRVFRAYLQGLIELLYSTCTNFTAHVVSRT